MITAIAALVSTFAIAPAVFQTNKWVVIAVVYGCVFGAQMLGRRMVYGDAKAAGIVVGAGLQGVALGFLLLVALATGSNGEGVSLIGYSLLMVVLSVAAMLLYVTAEKRAEAEAALKLKEEADRKEAERLAAAFEPGGVAPDELDSFGV